MVMANEDGLARFLSCSTGDSLGTARLMTTANRGLTLNSKLSRLVFRFRGELLRLAAT